MLTEHDKDMISYFITEKGDVARWTEWEKKKNIIEQELPELIHALNQVKIAERILSAVVKNL